MKLGILSDTHGQTLRTRCAIALLQQHGAEAFIHCGDVGDLDVLDELAGHRCWFVWGNTDVPRPAWREHLANLDLPWPDGPLELTLAGKRIAVFHGHEHGFDTAMIRAEHDYLLHGHSHQADDYRRDNMRVINPGALHRTHRKTVALLDLATDEVTHIEVA
ncbi:MAG: YfcE family phosphodiesterase [Oricola sp.]|nr:YfcE family phosphodiesterase [Oricola sp.]